MDEIKYSVKIKGIYRNLMLLFFGIFLVAGIVLLLVFKGTQLTKFILISLLVISILFRIYFASRPVEIQVYNDALNLKYLFGKKRYIYFKDIISFSLVPGKTPVIETKIDTIKISRGFTDLSIVADYVKNAGKKLGRE